MEISVGIVSLPLRAGILAALLGSGMLGGVLPQSARAQTPSGLSLPKAQVQCIVNQLDAFLDEPDDPVIVYLDLCLSTPDQNASAVAGQTRVDIPSVPAPKKEDHARPLPSVAVSKAVLRCLKATSATPGFPATDPVLLTDTCP